MVIASIRGCTNVPQHERSRLTAIFGSLPVGEYVVWEDADTAGPLVNVPDGGVAEVALP